MSRPYKQFDTFTELESAVKDGSAVPLDHTVNSSDAGYSFRVYRGKNNTGAAVYTGTSSNLDLEDLKEKVNEQIFGLTEEQQNEFMARHNGALEGPGRYPKQMTKEQFDAEVAAGTAVAMDAYAVEHCPHSMTVTIFDGYEESGSPKIVSWTGSEEFVCDAASDFSLAGFREQLAKSDEPDIEDDDNIEKEIQDKGLTAPRVTPDDIEANIASEYYFTAMDGLAGAGNIIENDCDDESLELLTFCVLVLKNGFTVTGESACASPENFDEELGRKIARQNAVEKIWPLMGYELKSKLARGEA